MLTIDLDAFEQECKLTGRQLRRLPAELRRALSDRVQVEVAAPLADRIGSAFRGPWADRLRAGTKARKLADPTIVVGGSRPVVRNGASVRQLVYGSEFGGGSRVTTANRERYSQADVDAMDRYKRRHVKAGQRRRGRVGRAEIARATASGRRIYHLRSTRQFVRNHNPAIFPTLRRSGGWVLDRFAGIVDDVLTKLED